MNTTSRTSIEQRLRSYSVYVENWDAEAGDTDRLLGYREILHDRIAELSAAQRAELRLVDECVLALAEENRSDEDWDATLLRQTADLIRSERESHAQKMPRFIAHA